MNNQLYKADAGKPMPDLLFVGMARALRLVQATMEYGAQKYEAHSWRHVDNAEERYFRAAMRHHQERMMLATGEDKFFAVLEGDDAESGLPHIAHEIFNLLALMELQIATLPTGCYENMLKFNPPPLGHKNPAPTVGEDESTRPLVR